MSLTDRRHQQIISFSLPVSVSKSLAPKTLSSSSLICSRQVGKFHSNSTLSSITMSNSISNGPLHTCIYGTNPAILLTNDDGVHPNLSVILRMAQYIVSRGHDVIVCAPGKNNSACGQRITLGSQLTLRRHPEYETRYGTLDEINAPIADQHGKLMVFSLDEGTPADCIITAIEPKTGILAHLGYWPKLTISGVNRGENIGTDIIYSGTFAGAKQSAIYGIPAIASSLNLYKIDPDNRIHTEAFERAIVETVNLSLSIYKDLPQQLPNIGRLKPEQMSITLPDDETTLIDDDIKQAFISGDIILNVNMPVDWHDGKFKATHLDSVLYRGAGSISYLPTGVGGDEKETTTLRLHSKQTDYMHSHLSDARAINIERTASMTPVATWPISHPLALPDEFINRAVKQGLKFWLDANVKQQVVKKSETTKVTH